MRALLRSTERLTMPKIFINFRNGDGEWAAEALRVVLKHRFGKDSVFLSHESIKIGERWPDALLENVATCDIFLALIGPEWLTIKGKDGHPKIFAEDDWVRREIATALAAGRTVTPILLGDTARLNPADDLPGDIRELADLQGPRLDVRKFDDDYAGLEKKLMEVVPGLRSGTRSAGIKVVGETVVAGNIVDSKIIGADVPSGAGNIEVIDRVMVRGNFERSEHKPLRMREPDQGKGDRG